MPSESVKNLRTPDQTVSFDYFTIEQVHLGDLTVGRVTALPGWRWRDHVRPHVGTEWCEARHVGVVISGSMEILHRDGSIQRIGPDDAFEITPGHDGYVVGDEPCVQIDWGGLRAGFGNMRLMGAGETVLATLLFTDLVESTATARALGDTVWRDRLSDHLESVRTQLERFNGREVNTTGDGFLATFDGPAAALACAAGIRRAALRDDLHLRASVHIGEVGLVGRDIRGIAVHEASRIMSVADADEILVSAMTRALAGSSGLKFRARGSYELKGLEGTWDLFEFLEDAPSPS